MPTILRDWASSSRVFRSSCRPSIIRPSCGARQRAYRILVASSEEKLARDAADLWDSGKVESDQSVYVQYIGAVVASMQRAWWKVRAWDETDRACEYLQRAWWEMGLQRSDWAAQSIGASLVGSALTTIPVLFAPRFRR
jgi:alpha-L-rhamnosidase